MEWDIIINLFYVVNVYLVFDYYYLEIFRNKGERLNYIINLNVFLVVCVVWEYYGGIKIFLFEWVEMMEVVDKGDLV